MITLDEVPSKSSKPSQQNRTGTPVSFRLDDELIDRLRAYHETLRPRPTLTALIEDALAEYLERHDPRSKSAR